MRTFKLKYKIKGRKTRGRKTRGRKTRGRKTRGRKTRGRKTRGRNTRGRNTQRVYKGGNIPAPFGTWVGNGYGLGGTGFNESGRVDDQAAIRQLLI